jgi:hypothetical protein
MKNERAVKNIKNMNRCRNKSKSHSLVLSLGELFAPGSWLI